MFDYVSGVTLTRAYTQTACYNAQEPSDSEVITLNCTSRSYGDYIKIKSMEAAFIRDGFGCNPPTSSPCQLKHLNDTHTFYQKVMKDCSQQPTCDVSSIDLFNSTANFERCFSNGNAIRDSDRRNILTVGYTCVIEGEFFYFNHLLFSAKTCQHGN